MSQISHHSIYWYNKLQEAECDSTTICDMLGSEEGVTNKNILQYMGIIEQRTMELIKIQQYIQMTV